MLKLLLEFIDRSNVLDYLFGKTPEEAYKFFIQKGNAISWDWFDLWQKSHDKAFTVAKVMKQDILQDIREIIDNAIEQGMTFEQFQNTLAPKLKSKGWWGKVPAQFVPGYDVESGIDSDQEVQLGAPWRLKTIYRTNLQSAYSVGRYKSHLQNVAVRPYWAYVSMLDEHTRPHHRNLDYRVIKGVFHYDDLVWNYLHPPNGFNCRCAIRPLTERQVEVMGLKVLDGNDLLVSKLIQMKGITHSVYGLRHPRNKKEIYTDIGWSYNVGHYNIE